MYDFNEEQANTEKSLDNLGRHSLLEDGESLAAGSDEEDANSKCSFDSVGRHSMLKDYKSLAASSTSSSSLKSEIVS